MTAPRSPTGRPATVLVAVIMTVIGSLWLILRGASLLIVEGGSRFGAVTPGAGLAWAPRPLGTIVGVGFLVLSAVLVALAGYAMRGANGARVALTVIGALFIAGQLALIVTRTGGAALPMVWIATALTLLWRPDAGSWFRRAAPGQPLSGR